MLINLTQGHVHPLAELYGGCADRAIRLVFTSLVFLVFNLAPIH